MCKQKLTVTLLVSAMYMAHACGMEQSLDTLRDRLYDLRDVLGGEEMPPPPPPREEGLEPVGPGFELPPPPVPSEGKVKPVVTGPLPPPPSGVEEEAAPGSMLEALRQAKLKKAGPTEPKPVTEPVIKPELGTENIPPVKELTFEEKRAMLKQQVGGEPAVKPVIKKTVAEPKEEEEKPRIEVKVPRYNVTNKNLTQYMQQLDDAPTYKQFEEGLTQKNVRMREDYAKKVKAEGIVPDKIKAHAILNGILTLVNKDPDVDKDTIMQDVLKILNINPLLISTAALIMQKIELSKQDMYNRMTTLYRERVDFIGQEIEKMKRIPAQKGAAYAGIRDDIDEAIAFPIELSGELQHAKNIIALGGADKEVAQGFVNRMTDLKAQLCRHIIENIMLFDAMYREFYRSFCAEETKLPVVYCETAKLKDPKTEQPLNEYIAIDTALTRVLDRINIYKAQQSKYWASKRIFELQYIVNTLAGFIDFFTDPQFCKICLVGDINRMQREKYMYKEKLAEIKQFLLSLADQEQNVFLRSVAEQDIPRLEALLEEQRCALVRGGY